MPNTLQENLNSTCFLQLVDTLAKNEEFCAIVQEVFPGRNNRMDVIIMETAQTIGYKVPPSKSVSQGFTARLVNEDLNNLVQVHRHSNISLNNITKPKHNIDEH
jgi:hypothetical protein